MGGVTFKYISHGDGLWRFLFLLGLANLFVIPLTCFRLLLGRDWRLYLFFLLLRSFGAWDLELETAVLARGP